MLPNIVGSSLVNVPWRTIGGRPVGVLRLTDGARWPVERELELLLVLPVELTALRGWYSLGDGGDTLLGIAELLTCRRLEARVPLI